jgi:hypothetical protein
LMPSPKRWITASRAASASSTSLGRYPSSALLKRLAMPQP